MRAATRGCSHLYLTLGLPYVTAVWQRDWPRVMQATIDAALAHDAVLVFFDNVYAYGPLPLTVPMREDHPLQPPSCKGAVRASLGHLLARAQHERGLKWVIGRSADFYGPGVRQFLAVHLEEEIKGDESEVHRTAGRVKESDITNQFQRSSHRLRARYSADKLFFQVAVRMDFQP